MENDKRTLARLLKAISNMPGKSAQLHRDGCVCQLTDGSRIYRFSDAVVTHALQRGLMDSKSCGTYSAVCLTAEGMAALVRLLDPENGFQAQSRHLVEDDVQADGPASPVVVNAGESPLGRLYQRRTSGSNSWIDHDQFQAGERLRRDFEQGGLSPRISANWIASIASSGRRGAGTAEISDYAIDARKRVEGAIEAVGPELSGVLLDVCCFLKGLESVERERRWPPRSAKLMLRTGLQMLVRHYGIRAGEVRTATRHWGESNYRPAIHG